jgi:hypothetical protein
MVHQTSSDLKKWGAVVEDVTYPTYTDRPGMPVVTKVRILLIFEFTIKFPSTDNDSFQTVNTSTSTNTALSSALQATRSLSTTVLHRIPRMLPPLLISVWWSRVVPSQPPRPTLYGRHMVARMAQSSQVLEHRVLCLLTRLLAKVNGQKSHPPKNMAIRGLSGCCQRMMVATWLCTLRVFCRGPTTVCRQV